MANHILGSTTAALNGYNTTAALNEIVGTNQLTLPANAYVTTLHAYFGSAGGGGESTVLILFDSGYALRAQGSTSTTYGEGWQSQSITPYQFGAAQSVVVGWWVTQGSSMVFHVANGNNWKGGSAGSPSSASGFGTPGSPYYQGSPNWYLEWIDPCTISSVSPSTAVAGQNVTLTGTGFGAGNFFSVTVNGIATTSFVNSDTQMTVLIPSGYTTGNIQVNSDHGSPTIAFTEGAPTISSISPMSAISGSTVSITGTGFTDGTVTGVSFNGIAASSFAVSSNTQMTAVVPNGFTSGTLQVSSNHGNATIAFTEGPPTISAISPTNATPGQTVTITGYGFTDGSVTSVTFTPSGQVPLPASSYSVVSNTSITAVVPTGSVGSDTITVNTNHGSATGNLQVTGTRAYDGTAVQNATPYVFDGANPQAASAIYIFDGTTIQQGI